ncbi:MAG TPA: hypothetical protein VFP27_18600 [Mycobacterium sp.]|jgi:hypothetical protein|nr:hypothetical protein [Mycobacterium sp.]
MKKLMAATALGGAIIGSLLGASSASAEPSVGYDGQPSESAFCADLDLKKPAMVTYYDWMFWMRLDQGIKEPEAEQFMHSAVTYTCPEWAVRVKGWMA